MRALSISDPAFLHPYRGPPPAPLPSDYWHVGNGSFDAAPYTPQQSIPGTSTTTFPMVHALFAVPFFVGRRGRTVSAIGAHWTVLPAAGAIRKFAIYDCLPPASNNVYPNALKASAELTLVAALGVQTVTFASPVFLPNGLYWIAYGVRSGLGGQVRALNSSGQNQVAGRSPLQWTGATINTALLGTTVELPNGSAMPTPFPANATLTSGLPMFEVL